MSDLLTPTPETAYFWGRVAGDGSLRDATVIVRARDEQAANALGTVAGVEPTEHSVMAHESAHDASIVRYEEEYELRIDVPPSFTTRVGDVVGIGDDYQFEGFTAHRSQLVRGLLEACGTICFRESSASVGISFVHESEQLLETLRSLLDGADPQLPTDELEASSSGGYWFGLADGADTVGFARWVYTGREGRSPSSREERSSSGNRAQPGDSRAKPGDSEASGIYSKQRRQKLRRSVERATGEDVGTLSQQ